MANRFPLSNYTEIVRYSWDPQPSNATQEDKNTDGRVKCTVIVQQILATRERDSASLSTDKNLGQPDHFSRRPLWSYLTHPPSRSPTSTNGHQQPLSNLSLPRPREFGFLPWTSSTLSGNPTNPPSPPSPSWPPRILKKHERIPEARRAEDSFSFTIITHTVTRAVRLSPRNLIPTILLRLLVGMSA